MNISRVGTVAAIAIAAALSLNRAAGSDEMHKGAAITADTLAWAGDVR